MEAMRKEIARLNDVIGKGCRNSKKQSGKENQPKKPSYNNGRHPHIRDGLRHTKGGKTNGRKVINGYECLVHEQGQSRYRSACTDGDTEAAPSRTAT
jgi:hypothetical protein